MFTGLVEEIGTIKSMTNVNGGIKITCTASKVLEDVSIDDSIAINGVCQTVIAFDRNTFDVIAIEETMRKTNFSSMKVGSKVNLERALTLSNRLGGHLVQGHVDTAGKIVSIVDDKGSKLVTIEFEEKFANYVVPVGSICLNGISLTVARTSANNLTVAIIPHTWESTNIKSWKVGSLINLEFDIIGKYIEKMISPYMNNNTQQSKINSSLQHYINQGLM